MEVNIKMRKPKFFLLLPLLLLVSCKPTNSSLQTTSEPSSSITNQKVTLSFYGMNDFHGAIYETGTDPGIFKISTFLKSEYAHNPHGSIFLNAGDLWQGSADSNINRGAFLTEAMNELKLDAFTLGNHEFDWYDLAIEKNKARADYPFLGANIIDKRTNELATNLVYYDDTFGASTMLEKNGVNIGIIGTMGSSLESSILGPAVANYSFEPVTNYIKNESSKLKQLGANLVVLLTHDSLASLSASSYAGSEYATNIRDKDVDLIISGHQHVIDNKVINGIPIMQNSAYGRALSKVEIKYDLTTHTHEVISRAHVNATKLKTYKEDEAMLALFAPYEATQAAERNEVIGTLVGNMTNTNLIKLAHTVMLDEVRKRGNNYPNLVASHNSAGVRDQLSEGTIKYADLYRTFPFDNEVVIIENVQGSTLNNFIRGDYKGYPGGPYEETTNYTLVTLDFMSYRENSPFLNVTQTFSGKMIRPLVREYFLSEGIVYASNF